MFLISVTSHTPCPVMLSWLPVCRGSMVFPPHPLCAEYQGWRWSGYSVMCVKVPLHWSTSVSPPGPPSVIVGSPVQVPSGFCVPHPLPLSSLFSAIVFLICCSVWVIVVLPLLMRSWMIEGKNMAVSAPSVPSMMRVVPRIVFVFVMLFGFLFYISVGFGFIFLSLYGR